LVVRGPSERKSAKVALLRLAFKPDADDLRQTPSLKVARAILAAWVRVSAFDLAVTDVNVRGFNAIARAGSIQDRLAAAHCRIVVTEWE